MIAMLFSEFVCSRGIFAYAVLMQQRESFSSTVHKELQLPLPNFLATTQLAAELHGTFSQTKAATISSPGAGLGLGHSTELPVKAAAAFGLHQTTGIRGSFKRPVSVAFDNKGGESGQLAQSSRSSSSTKNACWKNDVNTNCADSDPQSDLGVRSKANASGVAKADVQWLVQTLQRHVKRPANQHEPRVSNKSLAAVCAALIRALRANKDARRIFTDLGGLGCIRKLYLGDPSEELPFCSLDHPHLQLCLTELLAEICWQGALDVEMQLCTKALIKPLLAGYQQQAVTKPSKAAGSAPHQESSSTFLGGQAKYALDLLRTGLRGALKRAEHPTMWATLISLTRLVENPIISKHLLLSGFLQEVQRAHDSYSNSGLSLSASLPRLYTAPPKVSKQVPAFVGLRTTSALNRCSTTVKGRWLQGSSSLPLLSQVSHNDSASRQSISDTHQIAEDSADADSFMRACDRNFMLLRTSQLLRCLERAGADIAEPFVERTASGTLRRSDRKSVV